MTSPVGHISKPGSGVAWRGATGCQFERSSSANLLGRRARGY